MTMLIQRGKKCMFEITNLECLSGCEGIVIPFPKMSKNIYEMAQWQKFGVKEKNENSITNKFQCTDFNH